jgi:TonB family protein
MLSFGNVPLRVARAIVSTQMGAEHLRRSKPQAVLADYHFALPLVAAPAVDEGDRSGTNELSAIVLHSIPKPPTDLVFPNLIYDMADVEVQAVPAPANPKPQYPAAMQRQKLEARFAVYFVVDTSGHIDRETVELPIVQHEEFATAVLDVLKKWTFQPAMVAGHRVRERVKQPFNFRLK